MTDRGMGYKQSLNEATLGDLAEEVLRAREKFPGNRHLTTALGEEYGELCQAQLQRKTRKQIKREALQVACLALRIFEETDATFADLTPDEAKP